MKARIVGFVVAAVGAVGPLGAQCSSAPTSARQACYASQDLINYMTPQLATAIAGGSSTLGQSGALGGLGRFAISVRGTGIINGAFPKIGDEGFRTDGQPQQYAVDKQIVPGAGVDAAIGLTKGWSLGATHVGGIDLLVSALYLPDVEGNGSNDFSIKAKDGNLKLGYGVRVGILDESVVTPGVYVSYLQRDLPTMTLSGTSDGGSSGTGGTFALNDFSVKTTAWRLVASKNFLILGLQAGVGQDKYTSSAGITATVNTLLGNQTATGSASMDMTRTNVFAGAIVNFFAFKLVGEVGQVSGGSVPVLFNSFDKPADESKTYASVGLRIAY
ncbi:MAG TPA: hypothetical protein VG916_11755 [Gemmatimonadaceae bacterium]|nr:hypothetical protein [Gemmatimonadaceae bacterium]